MRAKMTGAFLSLLLWVSSAVASPGLGPLQREIELLQAGDPTQERTTLVLSPLAATLPLSEDITSVEIARLELHEVLGFLSGEAIALPLPEPVDVHDALERAHLFPFSWVKLSHEDGGHSHQLVIVESLDVSAEVTDHGIEVAFFGEHSSDTFALELVDRWGRALLRAPFDAEGQAGFTSEALAPNLGAWRFLIIRYDEGSQLLWLDT